MPDYEQPPIPDYRAFVGWGFQCLLIAVAAWGVTELSSLSRSVQDLNVKMAVVLERDSTRGDQVRDLEGRVKHLEDKRN